MKIIGKLFMVLLVLASIFSFTSPGEAASSLKKEMDEMVKRNIISGYKNGELGEKDNVTRAQFAAFVSRALELPEGKHSFKDMASSKSLTDEVAKVYSAGIMQGKSEDRFAPKENITRAEVASTMYNVLEYSGMKMDRNVVNFTDSKEINSGVLTKIYYISSYNIVAGHTDGSFKPAANATREQAAAFIYRFLMAKEQPATPEFDQNTYYIGTVENGKLAANAEKGHATYAEALTAFEASTSADAILKGKNIIGIKDGIVFGNNTLLNNGKTEPEVTVVYSSPNFSTQLTYMEPGREMRFIEATEQYVKIQAGGTIGYVKQEEVDFLPAESVKGQDYYEAFGGVLYHYQYNYKAAKHEGGYSIGPAPSGMAEGVKYKALDGVHFIPDNGGAEITHYPYFQYQSVRSKTAYTAEELDRYILEILKERSIKYKEYEDALTKSKLIGQGKFILQMQEKYNVNALFILAAAMHESKFGMSAKAQEKKNLFGMEVYDNGTNEGKVYGTAEESIEDFAGQYMDSDYADTWHGEHYNGSAPGNKTTGINVNYASDPAWGSKVAGHMYRVDKALGKKDLNKYQLGITNFPGVNVRSAPAGELLYEFARTNLGIDEAFGYPVIIKDSQAGYYTIVSELKAEDDDYNGIGWVVDDFITKIN